MNLRPVIETFDQMKLEGIITDFAIGGAMASVFYTEPFLTYDVDVFIALPSQPKLLVDLSPVYEHLHRIGYSAVGGHVHISGTPVQILIPAGDLEAEAMRDALVQSYEDLVVKVFRPEHLLAIYLKVNRPKDRLKCQMLLDSSVLGTKLVEAIVTRHGLQEQWKNLNRDLS
ncbi:MAG: hypothetical protein FJY66_06245 [Calditrichaeota bacterium]|nr:hypothetical protein [Calditrichota bacterium]